MGYFKLGVVFSIDREGMYSKAGTCCSYQGGIAGLPKRKQCIFYKMSKNNICDLLDNDYNCISYVTAHA